MLFNQPYINIIVCKPQLATPGVLAPMFDVTTYVLHKATDIILSLFVKMLISI